MSEWNRLNINEMIPYSDALSNISGFLGALSSLTEVSLTVLDTLKSFLVLPPSPLSAALSLLVAEIEELATTLRESGAYGLFLMPTALEELEFYKGGYAKYQQMILNSLLDVNDPNRPQIPDSGVMGALLIYIEADSPSEYLTKLQGINDYMGRKSPKFPSLINLNVRAVDQFNESLKSPLGIFLEGKRMESLRLEWEEPKIQGSFLNLFKDSKFFIERSKTREGTLLVTKEVPTINQDPLARRKEGGADIEVPLLNRAGESRYVWEPLSESDPFISAASQGLLSGSKSYITGSYSHTIHGLELGKDNGYYYRVRCVPQDVVLDKMEVSDGVEIPVLMRAGREYDGSLPSQPVYGFLPDIDTAFDMPLAILNIYRAAYLLRFDTRVLGAGGHPLLGSETLETEIPDAFWDRLSDSIRLSYLAGTETFSLAAYTEPLFEGEILGFSESVRKKTIDETAETLKGVDPFGGVDEALDLLLPKEDRDKLRQEIDRIIMPKVKALVSFIIGHEDLYERVKVRYQRHEAAIESLLLEGIELNDLTNVPEAFAFVTDSTLPDGFSGMVAATSTLDISARRTAIHEMLQLLDGATRQGNIPNWESIKILQDIVPEVNDYLTRFVAMIASYENMLSSTLDGLNSMIDSIQLRLDIMNHLLQYVEEILAYLDSLEAFKLNLGILWIPPSVGGVSYLQDQIISAVSKPDADQSKYAGGLVIGVGGLNTSEVLPITKLIQLIFSQ